MRLRRHRPGPRSRTGVRAGLAVAIGALVGGVLAPVAPVAAAPAETSAETSATAAVPALRWTPCRDGFLCTTARVPLDHDHPRGASIELALIKLPAGGPASQRVGSLFVNPGGPGGSGVDAVRGIGRFASLPVRARYDIVGFDPRGIARSNPLRCFQTFDEALSILPPFPFPLTTRQENRKRVFDQALAGACATHAGAIRDHMSTADVARDLDLLRQAVGDTRLNFLGYSYGSMVGSTYANLFPHTTGRMVIDGVLDPVAWTSGGSRGRTEPSTSRLGSGVGAQATLGEFFRLCDAPGSQCAFAGDARERYAALAAQLRRAPIVIDDPSGTFRFTYANLVSLTLGTLYDPMAWPFLGDVLVQLETLSQSTRATVAALGRRLLGDTAAQEEYPNFLEGFPGVLCADSTNPPSFDAWRRAADTADRRGYFGRAWTWASSVCLPWPSSARQDAYSGPWTARTATTVLVVGNRYDPATPYAGAVSTSRLLPNSRLLTYGGWGHVAYLLRGNFCVDSAVSAYLATGRVPAAGASCRPEGTPFGPVESRTVAAVPVGVTLPDPLRRALVDAVDGR